MAGYAWVESLEAYCFTAVVGVEPDEAMRRLGSDPCSCQPRTFEECFWAADGPQWAQVGEVDGGVLLAEHNGWRAEESVEALSRGARLACFFRNVQAVMRFVYAEDGRVMADFDPLIDGRPEALPADGLQFGLFAAEPSALTLVERLTGIRVRRTWLNAPQRAVPFPPLRSPRPPWFG